VWARRILVGFVLFMVIGNAAIVVPSLFLQWTAGPSAPAEAAGVRGIDNLSAVDAKVWRGAAPSSLSAYESLAAAGVTTVVDLRAEPDRGLDPTALQAAGLTVVSLPIRDGQTPTPAQIDRFLQLVADSPGKVFLHCGAGVGRTGSMAAAYLVATNQTSGVEATLRNLAVGPPSLEQIAFTMRLDGDRADHANAVVVAASRVLDAPRRIWTVLG
jgi:protein-tyrosine phosphatase